MKIDELYQVWVPAVVAALVVFAVVAALVAVEVDMVHTIDKVDTYHPS